MLPAGLSAFVVIVTVFVTVVVLLHRLTKPHRHLLCKEREREGVATLAPQTILFTIIILIIYDYYYY